MVTCYTRFQPISHIQGAKSYDRNRRIGADYLSASGERLLPGIALESPKAVDGKHSHWGISELLMRPK
jgi:hypothetical protein